MGDKLNFVLGVIFIMGGLGVFVAIFSGKKG